MSIIDIIMNMPCWYVSIFIIPFSLFYVIREVMERKFRLINEAEEYKKKYGFDKKYGNKYVIYYARDILSIAFCTVSSFIALYLANYISSKLNSFKDISSGAAILLIFLIIWGITGASGYLQYVIVAGKFKGK